MGKKLYRLVALVLIMVMLAQLLPAGALATEAGIQDSASDVQGDTIAQTDDALLDTGRQAASAESAYVVSEVESLRGENEKHFRMSDGSFMAVSYGEAVHYQDASGKWTDIDNTLTSAAEELQAVNGTEIRKFATVMEEDGYLFTAQSGQYSVRFSA
ncbi:MAG: hypothetical protein LBM28_01675, partial [Oscillospiraceae bacterium]|nr:hypothetical protein [Oscillospiraceae bacterium]